MKKNFPRGTFVGVLSSPTNRSTSPGVDLKTIACPDRIKPRVENGSLNLNIFEQVRAIASDVFGIPSERLSVESSPETVESWDSIQHLNLVLALEQEFNLQLSPEEIEQMSSIGRVTKVLEGKVQPTPG